jgi:hypothetical protein
VREKDKNYDFNMPVEEFKELNDAREVEGNTSYLEGSASEKNFEIFDCIHVSSGDSLENDHAWRKPFNIPVYGVDTN